METTIATEGSTEALCHLAGAINKSIEMECRMAELKAAKKGPQNGDAN